MISVTGLEFSYSQAPDSMKSVVQAAWLLAVAGGNIIVIIVASAKLLGQASEFFMFGVLMILDMFLLMFLAYRYTPYDRNASSRRAAWRWRAVGWRTITSRVIQTCDGGSVPTYQLIVPTAQSARRLVIPAQVLLC